MQDLIAMHKTRSFHDRYITSYIFMTPVKVGFRKDCRSRWLNNPEFKFNLKYFRSGL